MNRFAPALAVLLASAAGLACQRSTPDAAARASGYVDATEIRVAAKIAGRVSSVSVNEGARISKSDEVATIATDDVDLALRRARAERAQADAQVRLLRAGSRIEDVQQAQAQLAAADADRQAAESDLGSARTDETRFVQLIEKRAGATKQRDDAVARRETAEARLKAATDRRAAAAAVVARLKAGARPEELDAARARVAGVDAQIATLEHDRGETRVIAPADGVVTSRLVEPGELVSSGTPLAVIIDLDHAWVNAYVEAPRIPSLRLEQKVTVVTDAGDRLPATLAFIAPKAEFTPRNVQTAAERARLVYRVKVAVDNRQGVLKPGMPVEVEF
ncbi:MAG: HlyD family efflux transporter periplasmic adaptor subunit [Acidobacteriota bacterium]